MSSKKDTSKDSKESKIEQESILNKDGSLKVLAIGSIVYIPYIVIEDNIYEVRECIIESIGDLIENGLITIFYKCKFTGDSEERITLNILSNVCTLHEDADRELQDFLSKQIVALEEHTSALQKQLNKNGEHVKAFQDKLS